MEQFRSVAPLHAVQPPYNLFERDAEADVLPYAQRNALTVLAYGALCRGLLTGRMHADTQFSGDDLRRVDPKFQAPRFAQYLAAVDALGRLARERYGRSVLALAVRWILDRGPTIALWGARRPDQLDPIDDAMGWSLDAAAMREIDAILRRHVTDPAWARSSWPRRSGQRAGGRHSAEQASLPFHHCCCHAKRGRPY
jgi:aryl-alcohol dehydrogenase-like predicted oxidoreductase